MNINTELAAQVALYAFDAFAVDVADVAKEFGTDLKTARRYLDLLVNENVLVEDVANGKDRVWQFETTYDSIDRPEAEARVTKWVDAFGTVTEVKVEAPKAASLKDCKCGCGAQVNPGRLYRPGHDARHAGAIGKILATLTEEELGAETWTTQLPTEALKAKARAIGASQRAKASKKSARKIGSDRIEQAVANLHRPKVETTVEEGTVKVGRWEYPATRTKVTEKGVTTVTVTRNSKRDGSGETIEVMDAKSFVAN